MQLTIRVSTYDHNWGTSFMLVEKYTRLFESGMIAKKHESLSGLLTSYIFTEYCFSTDAFLVPIHWFVQKGNCFCSEFIYDLFHCIISLFSYKLPYYSMLLFYITIITTKSNNVQIYTSCSLTIVY